MKIKVKVKTEKPTAVYVCPINKTGLNKLQVSRDGNMSRTRG